MNKSEYCNTSMNSGGAILVSEIEKESAYKDTADPCSCTAKHQNLLQ